MSSSKIRQMSGSTLHDVPLKGESQDRRRTCRYTPSVKSVFLGWGWGGSQVEIPVELESISLKGCMVKSRVRPAPTAGQQIWFRATGMEGLDWIEGRLVSSQKRFFRKHEIRVAFVSELPFQTFKMLVYGKAEVGPEPETIQRPMHETDQWWR
jgi:hypothetical protein